MSASKPVDPNEEVAKIDPENEINAKVVLTWGVVCLVAFVFCLWLLNLVFQDRIFAEREKKTEAVGTELMELRHRNEVVLKGQQEEGFQGMTIEQAMEQLSNK